MVRVVEQVLAIVDSDFGSDAWNCSIPHILSTLAADGHFDSILCELLICELTRLGKNRVDPTGSLTLESLHNIGVI